MKLAVISARGWRHSWQRHLSGASIASAAALNGRGEGL